VKNTCLTEGAIGAVSWYEFSWLMILIISENLQYLAWKILRTSRSSEKQQQVPRQWQPLRPGSAGHFSAGMNGFEVSERIHQVSPDSRIIFVSANNSRMIAQAAVSDGAMGFVSKTMLLMS
jgi:CheY-like chemotaxis protein